MSLRTLLVLAAVGCAAAVFYVANQTVVPAVQSGAQVTPTGWMQLVGAILGTIGLGKAAQYLPWIQQLLGHFTDQLPENLKPTAKQVADETILAMYAKLFKNSANTEERGHLRDAAKLVNDAEFDRMFPTDAKPV